MKNHFTLCQGYVANFNKLNDILVAMEKEGKFGTPEYAELNRRFGWEFNGMPCEYYFGNMAKTADARQKFAIALRRMGKSRRLTKDFRAMAAMRGIGWVVCTGTPKPIVFNVWIEHIPPLRGAQFIMDVLSTLSCLIMVPNVPIISRPL